MKRRVDKTKVSDMATPTRTFHSFQNSNDSLYAKVLESRGLVTVRICCFFTTRRGKRMSLRQNVWKKEKSKMGKGNKIPAFLSTTKNEELESGYFTFHVFE